MLVVGVGWRWDVRIHRYDLVLGDDGIAEFQIVLPSECLNLPTA